MHDTIETNLPSVTVGKAVDILSDSYIKVIRAGEKVKLLPSVMLWGPPGVGKSQAIRQLGKRLEEETGKRVDITDVRLLLFNPIDLRGIPVANEDKTLAVWLKPKIFQMEESEDVINILFLDEISAAPPSVQAAAYQITLDRMVGEHRLPENCIVVAAGNRVTDKGVAYKMPKPLANRLMHLEIKEHTDAWREWALSKGIHEKVVGFLSFRRDYLMQFDAQDNDLAFATPRSWEMVSRILTYVSDDVETVFPQVAGLVGVGCATEFVTWCTVYAQLPDVEEIFSGKCNKVPKQTDVLYALVSAMASYAREHKNDMNAIASSIRYALLLPPDFSAILMKDYMSLEKGYKEKLMKIPAFSGWIRTKGRFLNGAV